MLLKERHEVSAETSRAGQEDVSSGIEHPNTVLDRNAKAGGRRVSIEDAIGMTQLSLQLSRDINTLFETLQRYRKRALVLAIADDCLHGPEGLFTDNELEIFLLARQGPTGARHVSEEEGMLVTSMLRILKASEQRRESKLESLPVHGRAQRKRSVAEDDEALASSLSRNNSSPFSSLGQCRRSGFDDVDSNFIKLDFIQELIGRLQAEAEFPFPRKRQRTATVPEEIEGPSTSCPNSSGKETHFTREGVSANSCMTQPQDAPEATPSGVSRTLHGQQHREEIERDTNSALCLTSPMPRDTSILNHSIENETIPSSSHGEDNMTYDGLSFSIWAPATPSSALAGANLHLEALSSLYSSALSPSLPDGFVIADENRNSLSSTSSSSLSSSNIFSQSFHPLGTDQDTDGNGREEHSSGSSGEKVLQQTKQGNKDEEVVENNSSNGKTAVGSLARPQGRGFSLQDSGEGPSDKCREKNLQTSSAQSRHFSPPPRRDQREHNSRDGKRRSHQRHKRKRWSEVRRLFECDFPACTKTYGTVQHLNVHRANCNHGPKKVRAGECKAVLESPLAC